jgi:thiamine-monophosphate kinase
VAIDTLVEGVHFPKDAEPSTIGHKALAVNLSDLAAMGAEPAWATLALTLPAADEAWLKEFCRGFFALAGQYNVALIGGDTTHGPLTITVQAHGFVPPGIRMRRNDAQPGDLVCVTGTLGDAGLALKAILNNLDLPSAHADDLLQRLHRPQPRVAEGLALRSIAHAAIDVSDGFAADLSHILEASGVGATVHVGRLPASAGLRSVAFTQENDALDLMLSAGDDYELCFTIPPSRQREMEQLFVSYPCGVSCVGVIEQTPGLRLVQSNGRPYVLARAGYDHFAS